MNDFENNVRQYVKTYKMLHGSLNVYSIESKKSIVKDLMQSFDYDEEQCYVEINNIQVLEYTQKSIDVQYGMMVGRFQPFHFGHQNVVNEIILSGKKPLIAIGSINDDRNKDKNPLSFKERKALIELIYPNNEVEIIGIQDMKSWDDWMDNTISVITGHKIDINNVTLFYHNKDIDRQDFSYRGKDYKNLFYTTMFEIENIKMTPIEFVDRTDFKIEANGRDIRHNLDGFKHFLDGRIYWELKRKGW